MTRRALLLLALSIGLGCSESQTDSDSTPNDGGGVVEPAREPGQPPISGGTLLITRDGLWAVAADPDVDRVAIVGISTSTPGCVPDCGLQPKLLTDLELDRGEEPGRLVEDGDGFVHVVLRRGAAIGTIDLASGTLLARRPVCIEPRGITYDESANLLHVACASGELVSLMPRSGEVVRRIQLDKDLRDVVVVPEGLVVSRFKSAQLIRIDHQGNVVARIQPTRIERGPVDLSVLTNDPLEGAVAWRTVSTGGGLVFMLHQYGLARPINIGTAAAPPPSTPYIARSACGGIVALGVSTLTPGGELQMGMPMPSVALSVDVAASSDGGWLAVAHTGAAMTKLTIYRSEALPTLGRSPVRCAQQEGGVGVDGQPVAVAMYPGRIPAQVADSDWLVVQTRNPRRLLFFSAFSGPRVFVELDAPKYDRGHDFFHFDIGAGIACAQCHPEGAEDGRVWNFEPVGGRRTQAVHVGLDGTGPFHWDGEFKTVEALVKDLFVRRAGLKAPSSLNISSLERWLFTLRPPAPMVNPATAAAVRGRKLFESTELGCTECHDGPAVAIHSNVDVGVTSPDLFQVPALRGVGYRAPYFHNGCAQTLRDRFASCGGGDKHGRTSQLGAAQIDDLIAYLESL